LPIHGTRSNAGERLRSDKQERIDGAAQRLARSSHVYLTDEGKPYFFEGLAAGKRSKALLFYLNRSLMTKVTRFEWAKVGHSSHELRAALEKAAGINRHVRFSRSTAHVRNVAGSGWHFNSDGLLTN